MMFAVPSRPYVVDRFAARCLETILILHLDHEQNASTGAPPRRRRAGCGGG